MGKTDTVTVKYMRQNAIFADAFNYFIYDGEQVIDPNSLEELDTREIDVPYGGEDGAEQPVQRTRDVIKSVTAMTDRKTAFLVLAIENQANIHYAMPVKDMVYDALQYAKQVEKAAASHKKSGDFKDASSDEYLSGFLREDKLMPVVTLVVYFDVKEWDGPLSIHEMFDEQDAKILALVPNYKINLIAPAAIPDEDFDKFNSTLKEVLAFIKYSRNKEKMEELLDSDPAFHSLERDAVDVINQCTKANLPINEHEEAIDVCLAIQEMNRDAAREAAMRERVAAQAEKKEIAESTFVSTCKELGVSLADTITKFAAKFGVSESDSVAIVNRYWQAV